MRHHWLMPALAAGLLLSASSLALAGTTVDGIPIGGTISVTGSTITAAPSGGFSSSSTVDSLHHGPMGHAGGNRHR
jgi:hypothetical protein